MLDSLPSEIIEQILGHLPTASSIANVACTSRKLHSVISSDNYGVFRNFVQRAFPSIDTPPLWRDMACALTSRSRAWDRKSFVARECHPPGDEPSPLPRASHHKFGYVPVIDSYEQWVGNTMSGRRQVLAFGTGGRLRMRITEKGRTEWKSLRLLDDHVPQNDILDVRLLRPHQHQNGHGETVILRKASHNIVKVESGVGKDNFTETSRFVPSGASVDCLDISTATEPTMVVCDTESLQLFPIHGDQPELVRPSSTAAFAHKFDLVHRKRCIKFLNDHTVATAIQFVQGRERAPIQIYSISATGISQPQFLPTATMDPGQQPVGRYGASALASLDDTGSTVNRPGQVFLSGWTDGVAKLHDLRTPSEAVAQYFDHVDDGQILCLSVVGRERFYAGSHQNACLKCFDLRMSGARPYSYLDASPQLAKHNTETPKPPPTLARSSRDINIFLALTVQRNHLWGPLPRQNGSTNLPRYRGSIYSLSTPSPSSPTLFAGIENHVIQLDFVNTDDILQKRSGACDPAAGLTTLTVKPDVDHVLNLSCYERPRDEHVATDAVLLRKQVDWHETVRGIDDSQYGPAEDGWDDRWRLTRSWKTQYRDRDRDRDGGSSSSSGRGRGGNTGNRRWRRGNAT